MNDIDLARRLKALARIQGAGDVDVDLIQLAIDSDDPFAAIVDAIGWVPDAALPTDVAAAYVAYRASITDPDWLAALRPLAASQVA